MNDFNENTQKKPIGQLIYNIASAVAILALFVLFFLKMGGTGTDSSAGNEDGAPSNIAYVNSDSLMNSYYLVDTLMAELYRINDSLEKDLTARQQGFEARVMAYQNNLQNGTITTKQQAQQQEAALQAEQQNLMTLSDQYTTIVSGLQAQMNYQIIDSVTAVIKSNRELYPYDVVLGYTPGAGILFVSEDLDITEQILEMLNKNQAE